MSYDDNVTVLPGVNRPDLVPPLASRTILESALASNLLDVAIVGRAPDGELVVWGSQTDADAVVGLLFRGAEWLAGQVQVHSDEKD